MITQNTDSFNNEDNKDNNIRSEHKGNNNHGNANAWLYEHGKFINGVINMMSLCCAVALVIWMASAYEPKAAAQRDYRYPTGQLLQPDSENTKDIVRLQEILRMTQQQLTDLQQAAKDQRNDSRDLHTAIDQIKGGVYVFVPILGVLNILGFISVRRRSGGSGSGG
jgi:hypothetical protein